MAQSDNILPKSLANNLRCTICLQYLSIPPITETTQGYQCGRCLPSNIPKHSTTNHGKFYKTLSQIIRFPCRYDSQGCTEHFHFNEMKNHENQCRFKTMECPIKECKKEIQIQYVLQHFQQQHVQHMTSSTVFSIPKERNVIITKMLIVNNYSFILKMLHSEENKCCLCLRCFDEKCRPYDYYKLEIKAATNSSMLLSYQKQLIREYSSKKNYDYDFDIGNLKGALNAEEIEIEVKFVHNEAKSKPAITCHLLQELECVVCSEYMVPPIYTCKTGHSVCSTCKNKIQRCPTCRAHYEGARNFALEKLSEGVDYPCKNKSNGCKFLGVRRTLLNHELTCVLKLVKCPLSKEEKCQWSGLAKEIYGHCTEAHCSWLKFGHSVYRSLKMPTAQDCHIVMYDGEIFKVYMKHDNSKEVVHWAVEHFQWVSNEKPKYRYVLHFTEPKEAGSVVTIKAGCFSGGKKYNTTHTALPYTLLKLFMQNEKLMFTINIEKISDNTDYLIRLSKMDQ